jgi:hypothetical protein
MKLKMVMKTTKFSSPSPASIATDPIPGKNFGDPIRGRSQELSWGRGEGGWGERIIESGHESGEI